MALMRFLLISLALLVLAIIVNASMGEELFKVPLMESGSMLWYRDLSSRITKLLTPNFASPWTYMSAVLFAIGAYYFRKIFLLPMNRVRMLGDVGYIPEGKLTQKEMANLVRKRRLAGDCPPVYPNGWFAVLESRDLKPGESRTVSCIGLNLAVFRGEDGQAYVLDAYCPHMGANIAVGGVVKGDCIECPFHGWKFRGEDGKCTDIPYLDQDGKIPEKANIKSYTTLELNNFIHIWYHAEGAEPSWTPPEIEEITKGQWTYRGRTEHIVNAHIEEVPENGADVAHLAQVHGPILSAGIDLRYTYSWVWSFAKHIWEGGWTPEPEPETHCGVLRLKHSISIFGFHMGLLDLYVEAKQIGPGIVYLRFESLFGKGCFLHLLTPIEPITQRLVHHIYFESRIPTIIGKFFMLGEALQVERDIMIWNNKRYEGNPVFVKSKYDSLVAKHRRWYKQFYSEHSPRLQIQKDTLSW